LSAGVMQSAGAIWLGFFPMIWTGGGEEDGIAVLLPSATVVLAVVVVR